MRQPTIKDVALKAGVSFKTVSRVLNGEPYVRDELCRKVKAAVAELDYHPNVAARGLIGAPSRLIGFLYDNPNFGYVTEAELGALGRCRSAGYYLAVEPIGSDGDRGRQIEQILASLRVDGLILTPPICDDEAAMSVIERLEILCVRISPQRGRPGSASILVDDAEGAFALTTRLLELGHRRVAFIQGPPEHGASHSRLQGYRRALQQHGQVPDPALIARGAFTVDSGREAGSLLLARDERPTAIFASNDEMAFGVMAAARDLGLDIPGDLSVAGFDDTRSAGMSWPPLTTIRQPIAAMCGAAVDMLIAAAAGELDAYKSTSVTTELIERGSIGPVP